MKSGHIQIQNRDDALNAIKSGLLSFADVLALSRSRDGRDLRTLKVADVLRRVKGVDAKKILIRAHRFGIPNATQIRIKDLTARRNRATLADALHTKNRRAPQEGWPFIHLDFAPPKAKSESRK